MLGSRIKISSRIPNIPHHSSDGHATTQGMEHHAYGNKGLRRGNYSQAGRQHTTNWQRKLAPRLPCGRGQGVGLHPMQLALCCRDWHLQCRLHCAGTRPATLVRGKASTILLFSTGLQAQLNGGLIFLANTLWGRRALRRRAAVTPVLIALRHASPLRIDPEIAPVQHIQGT